MNLRSDPDGVIRALTQMEGERWLERQRAGQFKGYSVFDAMEALKGISESDFSVAVIYGNDGWNRYRVTAAGKVQFIEAQAVNREAKERAKRLGFELV